MKETLKPNDWLKFAPLAGIIAFCREADYNEICMFLPHSLNCMKSAAPVAVCGLAVTPAPSRNRLKF